MNVNENMRKQNKCPLCGKDCYEGGDPKTWVRIFICPTCKEFRTDFYDFTDEERTILSKYFASIANDNQDRLTPITKNNYKEFVERAKKYE